MTFRHAAALALVGWYQMMARPFPYSGKSRCADGVTDLRVNVRRRHPSRAACITCCCYGQNSHQFWTADPGGSFGQMLKLRTVASLTVASSFLLLLASGMEGVASAKTLHCSSTSGTDSKSSKDESTNCTATSTGGIAKATASNKSDADASVDNLSHAKANAKDNSDASANATLGGDATGTSIGDSSSADASANEGSASAIAVSGGDATANNTGSGGASAVAKSDGAAEADSGGGCTANATATIQGASTARCTGTGDAESSAKGRAASTSESTANCQAVSIAHGLDSASSATCIHDGSVVSVNTTHGGAASGTDFSVPKCFPGKGTATVKSPMGNCP